MSEEQAQQTRAQLLREIRDRIMIEKLQRAKIQAYEASLQKLNADLERARQERDKPR